MIYFADIKHRGWCEDGNIVRTEDIFPEDVEIILMGGHKSDESDDTDGSDSEFQSDIDSIDDDEDDDA